MRRERIRGSLCLLLGTTIWGFSFIAQSVGMDHIGPFTFQAARCLLAVLFLIPCGFLLDAGKCSFRESAAKWKDTTLWRVGLICGCALFVSKTGYSTAVAIVMFVIVLVPVLGLFLGKKPPKTTFFSVALAVAGLYLLSCMGVSQINKGDLYLMGCALAFSVQITCIDRLAGNLDGLRMNCIQALVVTVLSLPFILLTKESVSFSAIAACWFPLVFSGVLSMGVAYTLQIVGQKDLEPTTASLIMSLESAFAALGGWLILHQTMTVWELLGCGLMFAGVVLSQLPVGIFTKKA